MNYTEMHVLPMNASYTEMQHDLFASMEMNKKHSLYIKE